MITKFTSLMLLIIIFGLYPVRAQHDQGERAPKEPEEIAFVNVHVVPMDSERILENQTVIVRDGRIARIGPAKEFDLPTDVSIVDGEGKYLIPGLVDMHVHFPPPPDEGQLGLFVANGVTTIRNMWGMPFLLDWRKRINEVELLGPTIYTTGPITDGKPPYWQGSTVVETPEEAQKEVLAQKQAGYDGMKVFVNLLPEVYEGILAAAKEHNFPVYGHVPTRIGLEKALPAGQRSFEHMADFMYALLPDDSALRDLLVEVYNDRSKRSLKSMYILPYTQAEPDKIPDLAAKAATAGVWVCPTLTGLRKFAADSSDFKAFRSQPFMKYVTPENWANWDRMESYFLSDLGDPVVMKQGFNMMLRMVKALHEAGARLLVGTDPPNPFVVSGFAIHEELGLLVEAGLSPYEALLAATRGAAEFLGSVDETGTIEVGKRADLVLLERNPLEKISNTSGIAGVVLQGRWLSRETLDDVLRKIAESYSNVEK